MNRIFKWILWIAGIVILILYPWLFGIYDTNVLVLFAIFALFGISFNILLGFTGLLSFGHAMFFGVGGYGTAIALSRIEGLALLPAVGIGVLAAILLALILCPLLVRVSGTAFAMLTLAFGQLLYVLALKLRDLTGGEDGVGGFPIPPFTIPGVVSIDMTDPLKFYYFAMAMIILSIWVLWFFTKTPLGSVMVGIRDNANRVGYLGFKVPQTKAVILVFSGAFAGVAGSIYALFQNLISADGAFHVMTSFAPVLMTMIGGVASFFGPIWGSAIFAIIDEITTRYTERVELVIGAILILVILFAPMGFVGFYRIVKEKWSSRRSNRTTMEVKS